LFLPGRCCLEFGFAWAASCLGFSDIPRHAVIYWLVRRPSSCVSGLRPFSLVSAVCCSSCSTRLLEIGRRLFCGKYLLRALSTALPSQCLGVAISISFYSFRWMPLILCREPPPTLRLDRATSMVIGGLHALTLLALGCSSDDAGVHCRWAPGRMLSRYTGLSRVARLKTSAQLLRDGFASSASGVSHMGGAAVFFNALDPGLEQSHTYLMGLSIFRFASLFQVRVCHCVMRSGWPWGFGPACALCLESVRWSPPWMGRRGFTGASEVWMRYGIWGGFCLFSLLVLREHGASASVSSAPTPILR
jgi:hypothetical protein